VAPLAGWKPVLNVEQDEHFGIIDIVAAIYKNNNINMGDWFE
jgi:hypothetical protein